MSDEEFGPAPPPDDMYEHVTVEVKPAYRFQLVVQPFDFGRFAGRKPRSQPVPNEAALPNIPMDMMKSCLLHNKQPVEVDNLIDDPFWWGSWFQYLSKNQIDRDDLRDLILSKLPVGKLYAVGCVPEYFPYLFNAHINPALEPHIRHNKEYFPSAFCIREEELTSFGILHDVAPRQVWAYQMAKKKWVNFPTLNYLPPRVNQMLAGEGGLVLLCGDPPPWVDPSTPEEPEPEPEPPKEEKKGEGEGEEAEEEVQEEEGEKKRKLEKPPERPPEKRIDPNGQKLIVVCNPIARTFRILPDMHCHLENLLGHIAVAPMSDQYVVYIVGYHPAIGQCPEQEGLRVGIFKSEKGKWRVVSIPQGRLYRPGISNYNRALPLITKDMNGTSIFCSAQIITAQQGVSVPVILKFRPKTRRWKAYSWPPAFEVEHPQVVECDQKLYIVARGVTQKSTMTIWTFIHHEYGIPDCKEVTKMPVTLYSKLFPFGYRLCSEFDCTANTGAIAFACREKPTIIACYCVKEDCWCELPLYPGYLKNLTFLGNWRFEPAAHAQV